MTTRFHLLSGYRVDHQRCAVVTSRKAAAARLPPSVAAVDCNSSVGCTVGIDPRAYFRQHIDSRRFIP